MTTGVERPAGVGRERDTVGLVATVGAAVTAVATDLGLPAWVMAAACALYVILVGVLIAVGYVNAVRGVKRRDHVLVRQVHGHSLPGVGEVVAVVHPYSGVVARNATRMARKRERITVRRVGSDLGAMPPGDGA